jgi:hypothetical protein
MGTDLALIRQKNILASWQEPIPIFTLPSWESERVRGVSILVVSQPDTRDTKLETAKDTLR